MNLPKKITPDLLIEAIVEIKYISNLPYEVLLGKFYTKLTSKGFTHVTQVNETNQINLNAMTGIQINLNPTQTFFNDVINVGIKQNSFVFNFQNKYPLWENYVQEMKNALEILELDSEPALLGFNRIGLRFINCFSDNNLFENINDGIGIKLDGYESGNTTIVTILKDSKYRIVLNIGDDYLNNINATKHLNTNTISMVDIDVIYETVTPLTGLNNLFSEIELCHLKEKEVFFSILKPEFIDSLNPEY